MNESDEDQYEDQDQDQDEEQGEDHDGSPVEISMNITTRIHQAGIFRSSWYCPSEPFRFEQPRVPSSRCRRVQQQTLSRLSRRMA